MKRKVIALCMVFTMVLSFAACGSSGDKKKEDTSNSTEKNSTTATSEIKKISMVTDTGGVNDQSFNQSAWEGLQQVEKDTGVKVGYLESKQQAEYNTNLDKVIDGGNNFVWGIGYTVSDSILNAADMNPDIHFGVIDFAFEDAPDNVTGVMFKAQESSFLAGYAAGKTTETGKVGFVGGQKSDIIGQFEYGYKAGVAYAAKELGKDITVDAQYADSFADAAKGKAIANKMFSADCDIVFHAAGGTGLGVIEAAKEANKFAIGVDRDQAYLAPDNILTSALKNVDEAIILVCTEAIDGKVVGGKNYEFGLAENGVGIPEENPNMDPAVYEDTMKVQEDIISGTIKVPYNESTYQAFIK